MNQTSNKKLKIFISHAWEDKPVVYKIEAALKAAGIEVWVDHRNVKPGDKIRKKVNEALEGCNVLLLMWSNYARESEWVEDEWEAASTLKKRIVPCLLDKTELPPLLAAKAHISFQNFDEVVIQLKKLEETEEIDTEFRKDYPKPKPPTPLTVLTLFVILISAIIIAIIMYAKPLVENNLVFEGYVKNKITRAPIVNAKILLTNLSGSTEAHSESTDAHGFFQFNIKTTARKIQSKIKISHPKFLEYSDIETLTNEKKSREINMEPFQIPEEEDMPKFVNLSDGLLAYYPLDGTDHDSSTNKHHGKVVGEINYVTGKIGQAASFNGSTGLISIGNKLNMGFSNFTISAWIRSNNYTNGGERRILNKGQINQGSPPYAGYSFSIDPEKGYLFFGFRENAESIEEKAAKKLLQELPINQYILITGVLTRNGQNVKLQLFVDGELVSERDNIALEKQDTNMPLTIGGLQKIEKQYSEDKTEIQLFNGEIDDVRIYGKALTKKEIRSLYQMTTN